MKSFSFGLLSKAGFAGLLLAMSSSLFGCNPLVGGLSDSEVPTTFRPGYVPTETVPLVISPTSSTLTASDSTVVADGLASTNVTLTLVSTTGVPVPGKTVSLSSNRAAGSDTITPALATTNALGQATFVVRSSVTGNALLVAQETGSHTSLAQTVSVAYIANTVSNLTSTIQGSGPVTANGTAASTVTITLLDAFSNPVSGLVPTFSATDTGSTNGYGVCTAADLSGVSVCTLKSTVAETKTLAVTSPVTLSGGSVAFQPGPASQLVYSTQPGGGVAGAAWSQQPVVEIRDAFGNRVTTGADATRVVTLALSTGTGTVSGTLTATAVGGIATFSGLSLNLIGTNKVLTASATLTSGAVTVASSAFTITSSAATQLAYSTQPGGGVAGAAWSQQPVVQIQDGQGNPITTGADATRVVTLALTTGSGAVSGTLTATAVAGIATFSGLSLSLIGTNKVLTASATITSGAVAVVSSAFTITHASASQLVFTTQPSASTVALVPFAQQPIVTVQDTYGNPVTTGASATASVTLNLQQGAGSLGGTSLSVSAVSGVASFTGQGLNIDLVGNNKILRATQGLITGDSTTFTITHGMASVVALTTQPGGGVAGAAWSQQPVAEVRDAFGNRVTTGVDASANLTASLTTGTGTLSGTLTVAASAGVATFSGLSLDLIGTNKVLTFTKANTTGSGGTASSSVASSAFTITHATGSQLAYATQPGGGLAGAAWSQQPVVQVQDAYGNLVTTGVDATRVVSANLTTGTGTLSGTTTSTAVAGVATFSNLSLNLIGTNKVLTASATVTAGAATVASSAFTITHAAASQLAFATQPGGGNTGAAWAQQPIVQVQDPYGNLVTTSADASRTIALTLSTGPGTLSGTASLAAASGVATFSGLNIQLQGTGDKLSAGTTLSAGAVTVQSGTFNITLGAALGAAGVWPFTAGTDSSYTCNTGAGTAFTGTTGLSNCNQDLTGGVVRLTASSQTDNSNACTTGFGDGVTASCGGTFSGGAQWDATNSLVRIGTSSPSLELDPSWAPAWSNLVGYWRFNNDFTDAAKGNTGTAYSGAGFTAASKFGAYASSFAGGATSYVEVLDPGTGSVLDFTNGEKITISAWVNPTSMTSGSIWPILSKGGVAASSTDQNYSLRLVSSDGINYALSFIYRDSADTTFHKSESPFSTLVTSGWHHVVMTYVFGTGGSLRFYLDGVPQTPAGWATGNGNSAPLESNSALWIGGMLGSRYIGTIDDLAIFRDSLSASAIQQIYQHQSAKYAGTFTSRVMDAFSDGQLWKTLSWSPSLPFGKSLPTTNETHLTYSALATDTLMTGIQGLWHLDEPAGTTGTNSVIDSSGNNLHGTPNTMTFGVAGPLGTGVSATAGLIDFGASTPAFAGTLPFSVSIWFKTTATSGYANLLFKRASNGSGVQGWGIYVAAGTAYFRRIVNTAEYGPASTGTVNDGKWHHAVMSYNGAQTSGYIDGVLQGSAVADTHVLVDTSGLMQVGNALLGSVDEGAVWNRALSSSEVLQLYRRGANRILYQVRSCSDATCTTGSPPWLGPDGTNQSYFSELYNTASNSLTGAVSNGLPTMTFTNFGAPLTTNLAANRYFQYRAIMEADSAALACDYGGGANTSACFPELKNVTVGPTHYDSSIPTISNAVGPSLHYLTGLTETVQASACLGGIKYLLSPDNASWYYYNTGGSAWSSAGASISGTAGYALANTAATLTPSVLNAFAAQAGTGSLYYKAFLKSDGVQACALDDVTFTGNQ